MLQSLSIRDIVLIDRLELSFEPGLSALTGETGAGKSILLDSLGLALGARSEGGLVRKGAARGTVTAVFDSPAEHPAARLLEDQGLDIEEALVLRRTIHADGRSRAFVNDQPVSVGLLRRLGKTLIEIQSERAQVRRLDPASHRPMVDSYGTLEPDRATVAESFEAWCAARDAEAEARATLEAARNEEDLLRHALVELDALAPKAGEETALAADRARLVNGRKILDAITDARSALHEGPAMDERVGRAQRSLAKIADMAGGALDETIEALERASIEITEAMGALERAAGALDLDPARLEAIEERLFSLRTAARKYRTEPDSLEHLRDDYAVKLDALEAGEDRLDRLSVECRGAREAYLACSETLTAARRSAARALDEALLRELKPLKLEAARFATNIEPLAPERATGEGLDHVRFEAAMNPGTDLAPLERVASGGELSRLLLALKVVLSRISPVPTLVFDEIDQGIGGATAQAVGERLARLAKDIQVIVVTHSPQVAARANHHIRVSKRRTKAGVITELDALSGDTRRDEIARMLAGAKVTDEARRAAEQLILGRAR
ncbi:MAG: DNA repair protein RecN [Alphaproteobacteria bacterium]